MKSYYKNINHLFKILIVLMLTGIVFCPAAHAHKVSIFAWVQGNTIHTQSKMMGGKRPKDALVEVFDENETLLLQGRTDAQGKFSFPTPEKSFLKIVLNAGAGHRATWSLTPDDFIETTPDPNHTHTPEQPVHSIPGQTNPLETGMEKPASAGMSRDEIATLVGTTLDQKLASVMAKLAEMDQSRIKISDILGGLGYILGLVGLAAYMHYRRQTRGKNT